MCFKTILLLPVTDVARTLVAVPREPVRVLTPQTAVARAVDARDGRMPATAAVGERSQGKWSDNPTVRAHPLFALFCPMFEPRLLKTLQLLTRFIPE